MRLTLTALLFAIPALAVGQDRAEPDHHTFTGTVAAQARVPTVNSDGVLPMRDMLPIEVFPVHDATIIALQGATQKIVGTTTTDDDGTFTIETATYHDDPVRFYVLAESLESPYDLRVEDCPMDYCPLGANVYGYQLGSATPSDATLGDTVIPITSEAAGAFSILRVLQDAERYIVDAAGRDADALRAQWRAHSNTSCYTSCYGGNGRIYLLGLDDDSDEFDDDILRHEFGHFVEVEFLGSHGPGGFHDGSPAHPTLGFSEGFCTGFSVISGADPLYLDTNATGGGWYDYGATNATAAPDGGLWQQVSEDMIAESLWQLSDAGVPVISSVVAYLSDRDRPDRGAPGNDFVDAVDGLVCEGDAADAVRDVVVDAHGFPHDAAPDCEAGAPPPTAIGKPPLSPITPSRVRFEPISASGDEATFRVVAVGRSMLLTAELELVLPAGATLQSGDPRVTVGPIGPDQEQAYTYTVSGLAADDVVSARLSSTLAGGSAYHMSASYRPVGDNTPATYDPDESEVIPMMGRPSIRAYGGEDE